VLDVSSLAKIV